MYKRILTVIAASISLTTTSFASKGAYDTKAMATPECSEMKNQLAIGAKTTAPRTQEAKAPQAPSSNAKKAENT